MTQPVRHDDTVRSRRKSRIANPSVAVAVSDRAASDAAIVRPSKGAKAARRVSASASSALASAPAALSEAVRSAVGEQNYQHWFCRSCLLQVNGDRLVICVANPFILNWMLKRFRTELSVAAQRLLGPSGVCHFEVDAALSAVAVPVAVPDEVAGVTAGPVARSADRGVSSRASVDQPAVLAVAEAGVAIRRVGAQAESVSSDTAGRRRFRDFS
ncbi:MAG: DnaA N-terminal domain-containing protein, partial [Planctomycetaceae bacterium]